MNRVFLLLTLSLASCAPIAPSISKRTPCDAYDRSTTISLGDRSYDVDLKMNLSHTTSNLDNDIVVWTYRSCATFKVTFINDEVIQVTR